MKRTAWMREAIAAGKDFHVMRQDRRAHNTRNLLSTALVLAGIAVIVASAAVVPVGPYLVVAPWLLGSLYFSLFKHWEEGHLVHHLRPCEDDDPQDRHPVTGWPLAARLAVLALVPGSVLVFNPSNQYGFNPKRVLLGVLGLVVPAVLVSMLIAWPAGVAVVLGMHALQVFNLLKKAQEHGGGLQNASDPLLRSRTYFYGLQKFASPFNIHYHFEHHANFRVPWYALPAYHQRLKSIVPTGLQPHFFHHRYIDQAAGRFPPVDEALVYGDQPDDSSSDEAVAPAAR